MLQYTTLWNFVHVIRRLQPKDSSVITHAHHKNICALHATPKESKGGTFCSRSILSSRPIQIPILSIPNYSHQEAYFEKRLDAQSPSWRCLLRKASRPTNHVCEIIGTSIRHDRPFNERKMRKLNDPDHYKYRVPRRVHQNKELYHFAVTHQSYLPHQTHL